MYNSTRSQRLMVGAVVVAVVLTVFSAFSFASPVAAAGTGHKHPEHPYMGVEIATNGKEATVVNVMPDSPAAKAGLKKGDIITAVDGQAVTAADIAMQVTALKVGKEIKLSVVRDNKAMDISLTLGDMPVNIYWVDATNEAVLMYRPTEQNWMLVSVGSDAALTKAGFKDGDTIKTFDGKAYTADTLAAYVAGLKKTAEVTVGIERDSKAQDIKVSMADLSKLTASPVVFYEDELHRSGALGIQYLPLTPALAGDYGLEAKAGVLVVTATATDEKAGLKLMDVITAVNNTKLVTVADFTNALAKVKAGDKVALAVDRAGKTEKVEVKVGSIEDALNSAAGALAQLFHLKGNA